MKIEIKSKLISFIFFEKTTIGINISEQACWS